MHKNFSDTLFIGRSIIELEKVDSTNNFAAKLLNEGKPAEGTAILAYFQESGKGQRENIWQSEAHKNLTVSFILYPNFITADKQFSLNIVISLALYDYFENEFGNRVKIKWPNDIYIDRQKVAGILIENTISGSWIKSSIIGIGINLNQESFGKILKKATSKSILSGKKYEIKDEFFALCSFMEARYLQFKAGKTEVQKQFYLGSLFQFKELAEYESGGKNFCGTIQDITAEGKLIIQKQDLATTAFDLKEITFL